MKIIISYWDGTCAECYKEIDEAVEIYFCSKECADKYREWIIKNMEV
jgi:hypothetical protein